jgi:hypothetical protein
MAVVCFSSWSEDVAGCAGFVRNSKLRQFVVGAGDADSSARVRWA